MKRKEIRKRTLAAILAAMMAVSTWMPSDQIMAQTAEQQEIQTDMLTDGVQDTETETEGTEVQTEEPETETEGTEAQTEEPETETEGTETPTEEAETEGTEAQTEEPETEAEGTEAQTEEPETETEETETQVEELEIETEDTEAVLKASELDTSKAVNIQLDKKYTGKLTTSSIYTAYRFTMTQSGTLNLNGVSTDMSKMAYILLDENKEFLKRWQTYMNDKTGWDSINEDVVLTAGTYYLFVGNEVPPYYYWGPHDRFMEGSAENGTFSFTLNYSATEESFPEKNGGSNNTIETASSISLGKKYTAQIALNDEEDYFKFYLNAPSKLSITLLEGKKGQSYSIYTEDGESIEFGTWLSEKSKSIEQNETHTYHLTKGTFYINFHGAYEKYKFMLKAEKDKESFEEGDGKNNNTLTTANAISIGKTYYTQIAKNDKVDYFKFTINKKQKIDVIKYIGITSWVELTCSIYDSNGNEIEGKASGGKYQYAPGDEIIVSKSYDKYVYELEKGVYYLGIQGRNSDTGVTKFYIRKHKPDMAKFYGGTNKYTRKKYLGINLTWQRVSGATGYKIYRKEGNGSYKLIKTVKDKPSQNYMDNTQEFLDKNVKDGKTYTYKMKTLEGKLVSDDSEEKSVYCDNPNIKKYTVTFYTNGGYNLSISRMRVKPANKIGKLPSVQKSGYTFKGWYTKKSGGTKVTSKTKINKDQTFYAQWTKTKKPSAVGKITVQSKKKGQLAVTCKTVKNASGYEISYSTSSKFAKGATKTVNSKNGKATIKKLKSGKKYYVRVRAYKKDSTGKKYYGKYSGAKSIKIKK